MSDVRSYGVRMKFKRLTFGSATPVKLFSLPTNSVILNFVVEVITAFNDSGTDLLDLGTYAVGNAYANDVVLSAQARIVVGETTYFATGGKGLSDIWATYVGQNGNATAGEARVSVVYASPFEN